MAQTKVVPRPPSGEGEAKSPQKSGADVPLRLDDFLPYQLNVAASVVSQALSRLYAERYGIGVPEWRVLVTLGEFESMTGKAIGAHSHMHKTKVSRAVALLEKRKWLVRRVNRSDLREAFLSLTPEGRAIYEDLSPGAVEFSRRIVEAIEPADRPAFERALQQIIRHSRPLADEVPEEFHES
jgi:DNA-binding MarR family transcriptional regulator